MQNNGYQTPPRDTNEARPSEAPAGVARERAVARPNPGVQVPANQQELANLQAALSEAFFARRLAELINEAKEN
jgi:hypothetical protein